MAPNFERNLNQSCTYWGPTGVSDVYGKPTFSTPVLMDCRWEDITELFIDKNGQEVRSRSRLFLKSDVDLNGYLALGDHTSKASPLVEGLEAWEVRNRKSTPDLRALKSLYVVWL
jgi:hypothetical protein